MFSRWQNYAIDGTIYGIKISTTLAIMDDTRLATQAGNTFEFDQFMGSAVVPELQMTSWRPYNFDHKEKFRRTLALYETAIKHNWPLTNCLQNLNELKSVVDIWIQNQQKIRPRTVIPLVPIDFGTK